MYLSRCSPLLCSIWVPNRERRYEVTIQLIRPSFQQRLRREFRTSDLALIRRQSPQICLRDSSGLGFETYKLQHTGGVRSSLLESLNLVDHGYLRQQFHFHGFGARIRIKILEGKHGFKKFLGSPNILKMQCNHMIS